MNGPKPFSPIKICVPTISILLEAAPFQPATKRKISFVKSGIILENVVAPFLMRRIKQYIAVAFAALQTVPCSHAPNANTQFLRRSHLPLLLRLLPAPIRTLD